MTRRSNRTFNDQIPSDPIGNNPHQTQPIGEIIAARLCRRTLIKGILASSAAVVGSGLWGPILFARAEAAFSAGLTFKELAHGVSKTHAVAKNYQAVVLIRWGDPLTADAPVFNPNRLSADAQEKQFGYNNDFIAFMPLPLNSKNATRGLLCVNHEYTNTSLMFSGINRKTVMTKMTKARVEVELAAHGHSIVEVQKKGQQWSYIKNSPYNRRLTTRSTRMLLSGPAAGHDRLKTPADPTGDRVIGTLANCSGGKTPWGTVLIAEENFHYYFSGNPNRTKEARNYLRYGIKNNPVYPWWGKHFPRFNVEKAPNEANHFGWIVEFNPYNPDSTPIKRTALGRFNHEGATTVINFDGRVVVYSGDDSYFEYIYKFVTHKPFDATYRDANRHLLDDGTLYVAKFRDDGWLTWLPLIFGNEPLTPENGFNSQADVLIETRRAADLMGATPMDRPEDVETNPVTGVVYVSLTKNPNRAADQVDAANPRANNQFGHIIAMVPPGAGASSDIDRAIDHAATDFTWELPILCGNPNDPAHGAQYHPAVSANGWFAAPDNIAFDSQGHLWVATDHKQWPGIGFSDGLYACAVDGAEAYLTKHFFRVPIGAEMCGPEFTPDDKTLFLSVQHPAADGVKNPNFKKPATRWPDFQKNMPPRPSVVVVTKDDDGVIGA
jgi:secreted PhoX family phosphatase